tara:strand:- start:813 stop:1553 length:741 start_codon:yes stop_codon:yes gene_type:complete
MNTPVYFISDIHLKLSLDKNEIKRREQFYSLLDKIKQTGGTCFFVGDLFDFYFEYPNMIPKAFHDFYSKASILKRHGIKLYFLTGNHDYWVGDYIKDVVMTKVYLDDHKIKINGKKFYITHGDGLLSWDHGYRLLKKITRSKIFIWLFYWIHPTIAYKIASYISRSGDYSAHRSDLDENVRIELQKVAKSHFDNGFDYMISGHYHLGEIFTLNKGKLAVLGDWFFKPSYAVFDGNELELKLLNKDD